MRRLWAQSVSGWNDHQAPDDGQRAPIKIVKPAAIDLVSIRANCVVVPPQPEDGTLAAAAASMPQELACTCAVAGPPIKSLPPERGNCDNDSNGSEMDEEYVVVLASSDAALKPIP